ncbi:MAG: YjbH domain-containing protein, partial [Sulfurovum sp.]|nr:YjbH domain-containing protein [Sulfurovum sp.]
YTNYYLVADKSMGFLRASLGYGYSRTSVSYRMDGLFGGVEAQLLPWLTLLGEYDGEESHAGMQISIPHEWSDTVQLNTTIASNISDDYQTSFMISALFPLHETKKFSVPQESDKNILSPADMGSMPTSLDTVSKHEDIMMSAENLAKDLVKEGLENVTVATQGDRLYISYENNVYIWNEIDALGVVLRKAVKLAGTYTSFMIEPKKSNVLITSFTGSLEKAAAYFEKPSYATKKSFLTSLGQHHASGAEGFDVHTEDLNSGLLRTRIVLSPKLTTFVATEVGLFDYQLLLRTVGYWNLYKGLDLSVRYDIPVSYSDNLDPDTGTYRDSYSEGGLNAVMLNYTANINGGFNTLSLGSYEYDYVGAMDQFIYNYNRHTFKVKLGYFQDRENELEDKKVYLAKYTYSYEPLDLLGEIQVGKYWYQDTGVSMKIKHFFGDVAVSLEYLQTQPDGYLGGSEATNKYAGLSIELPLDFRKNRSSGNIGQVRGVNSLSYKLRSTIARADGTNTIVPSSGSVPVTDFESEEYLLNRNRMDLGYIKEHADRLLDVF